MYSAVDGLALQAADEERTANVLLMAEKAQIPVLTFESDLFPTTDVPTVGSNSYDAGYSLGPVSYTHLAVYKRQHRISIRMEPPTLWR